MLKIGVFGTSKWSHLMKRLIENEYSNLVVEQGGDAIVVDAFVTLGDTAQEGEITVTEFGRRYRDGRLSAIVIPKEYYIQQNDLVFALIREGVELDDIYDGMRLHEEIAQMPEVLPELLTPIMLDPYLSYLEFHVADHCNLNCKYCTHYSPLVQEPVFTDYEQFSKDLAQLRKYIVDIGVIRILGGEPLLNPQLGAYIKYVRSLYPASIITVVTNGLLIPSLKEELVQMMKECRAFFHISYYPPMEAKIGEIQKHLYELGIPYTITAQITEFNQTQTLAPRADGEFFYQCFQATCTCLHQGKVAPCYAPFTTKYFNQAFQQELPVDEGIDLYAEDLSAPMIKAGLLLPMERCRYCIDGAARPWEIVGRNSNLEDWV